MGPPSQPARCCQHAVLRWLVLLSASLASGFSPLIKTAPPPPPKTCTPEQQSLPLLFPPTQRPTSLLYKGPGIWVFEQPFYTTTNIKTRMSVLKLKDAVVLYSPIAATEEAVALVQEAAGSGPTHIIMQNDAIDHTLFLPGWRRAFPSAQVMAVSPSSPTDQALVCAGPKGEVVLPPQWTGKAGPLKAALLDVSPFFREVVVLHEPSKTLLVADSVWRVVSESFSPNVVASVGWRLFGVKDTSAFPYWFYAPRRKQQEVRRFLEVVGGWDFRRVMTGHLDVISDAEEAKEVFLSSFDYIVR